MQSGYDVVVCGGGTAGTIAAIQAGRAGASTLLVERGATLGGVMTVGGINAPAVFFAHGRQIIRGIGWELVRRTLEESGETVPGPEISVDKANPPHVRVDRFVYSALCDEAVLAANVDLLLHAMPAAVVWDGSGWAITVCAKQGLARVRAKVLIDATGDANVAALAGFAVDNPETVQPATLVLRCSGYDVNALDLDALKRAADEAVAAGELKSTDFSWNNSGPARLLRWGGGNANHIRAPGAHTSEGRTAVELEGRRAVMRAYRFLRRQPGLGNFRVDWVAPETGIRETVRIVGKATITTADYLAGRHYEDAVCYAYYAIDEHLNDGQELRRQSLGEVLPTIPRGALLPAGSRFLVVAGRAVSSERLANSALRVQCPCMAMGQAAGAMAALSARTGSDPEALPMGDLRELLVRHDAIVPGTAGSN